jgi:hypothetical protein
MPAAFVPESTVLRRASASLSPQPSSGSRPELRRALRGAPATQGSGRDDDQRAVGSVCHGMRDRTAPASPAVWSGRPTTTAAASRTPAPTSSSGCGRSLTWCLDISGASMTALHGRSTAGRLARAGRGCAAGAVALGGPGNAVTFSLPNAADERAQLSAAPRGAFRGDWVSARRRRRRRPGFFDRFARPLGLGRPSLLPRGTPNFALAAHRRRN